MTERLQEEITKEGWQGEETQTLSGSPADGNEARAARLGTTSYGSRRAPGAPGAPGARQLSKPPTQLLTPRTSRNTDE